VLVLQGPGVQHGQTEISIDINLDAVPDSWCKSLLVVVGLKSSQLSDVVLPTSGLTAGLVDDTDERLDDEATEAEMSEIDDDDDDDSVDEEMEADVPDDAKVRRLPTDCLHPPRG